MILEKGRTGIDLWWQEAAVIRQSSIFGFYSANRTDRERPVINFVPYVGSVAAPALKNPKEVGGFGLNFSI